MTAEAEARNPCVPIRANARYSRLVLVLVPRRQAFGTSIMPTITFTSIIRKYCANACSQVHLSFCDQRSYTGTSKQQMFCDVNIYNDQTSVTAGFLLRRELHDRGEL